MAYIPGDEIDDADYDTLAAAIRAEWGVGSLDHGLGQSVINLAQVDELQDMTALQWNTAVQATNKMLQHQGQTPLSTASISPGDDIVVILGFAGAITTASLGMGQTALPLDLGTPTTASTTTAWGSKGLRNLEFTHIVTFASANQARYFFNAGGKINLSFSRTGGTVSSLNTAWTNLCNACGTISIGWRNTTTTGSATAILNTNNGGYWAGTPGYTQHFLKDDATLPGNYIKVEMLWGGTTANGGYPVLTIRTTWMNANGTPGLNAVNGTSATSLVIASPSTAQIPNSWGTPPVSGLVTAQSSGETSFPYNLVIASDTQNVNLRSLVVGAGWNQVVPVIAHITVNSGVYVGATSTTVYALDTGSGFPTGSKITLINNGYIIGAGGKGGDGGTASWEMGAGLPGQAGGHAMRLAYPTAITNNGTIAGGGGGGSGMGGGYFGSKYNYTWAGAGAGGGAGYTPGAAGLRGAGNAGANGNPGTRTAGGAGGIDGYSLGYYGGHGGGLGQAGSLGPATIVNFLPGASSAGAAGYSIIGWNYSQPSYGGSLTGNALIGPIQY